VSLSNYGAAVHAARTLDATWHRAAAVNGWQPHNASLSQLAKRGRDDPIWLTRSAHPHACWRKRCNDRVILSDSTTAEAAKKAVDVETPSPGAKVTEIAGRAHNVVADLADKVQRAAKNGGRELWESIEKASHVALFVFVIISFISSAHSRSALRAPTA